MKTLLPDSPDISTQRIPGFDLARAYALLGMFIVNFNFAFGSFANDTVAGKTLNFFVGKSTAVFIVLAGMGLSFMVRRIQNTVREKKDLRKTVLMRSWFLFAGGLLLFTWWPGDILHFYGAYMHIAAFVLFAGKKYYLWFALTAIAVFHVLLLLIPVETGWDFAGFRPVDFWTWKGFIRNTLYNGWNAVFPWIAYFMLGMWMGRLDWNSRMVRIWLFSVGAFCFSLVFVVRIFALRHAFDPALTRYLLSEYFPPYLPFMLNAAGFALMVITVCMALGDRYENTRPVKWLAATGSMTLSHYVLHLTLGMLVFSAFSGIPYTGIMQNAPMVTPGWVFKFALLYFLGSVMFSVIWKNWFAQGPLEKLMRWMTKIPGK